MILEPQKTSVKKQYYQTLQLFNMLKNVEIKYYIDAILII